MPPKRTINLSIDEDLLQRFNEACSAYGHGKQKGLVLSAAIRMFLDADPRDQGAYLEAIFRDDIDKGVATMMAKRGEADRPRKAAKKRGPSQRPVKRPDREA